MSDFFSNESFSILYSVNHFCINKLFWRFIIIWNNILSFLIFFPYWRFVVFNSLPSRVNNTIICVKSQLFRSELNFFVITFKLNNMTELSCSTCSIWWTKQFILSYDFSPWVWTFVESQIEDETSCFGSWWVHFLFQNSDGLLMRDIFTSFKRSINSLL